MENVPSWTFQPHITDSSLPELPSLHLSIPPHSLHHLHLLLSFFCFRAPPAATDEALKLTSSPLVSRDEGGDPLSCPWTDSRTPRSLCSRRPVKVTGGEVRQPFDALAGPQAQLRSSSARSGLGSLSVNEGTLAVTLHLSCLSGTGSSSFYSVAMVSVPDCVDSGTQTDITFQNIVAVGRSRGRHHQHQQQGPSPSPPPPSPPPPHLMAPNGLDELYVLTCVG